MSLSLPITQESTNGRLFQAGPGIKGDPISKLTKNKKDWGIVQVAVLLPSKHKTLS
jgi:hypothetical protein